MQTHYTYETGRVTIRGSWTELAVLRSILDAHNAQCPSVATEMLERDLDDVSY